MEAVYAFVVMLVMLVVYLFTGSTTVAPEPRRVPAAAPTTLRKSVRFNKFIVERTYGKKSGNIGTTRVIQAPAA